MADGDRISEGLPLPDAQHIGTGTYSIVRDWSFRTRPGIASSVEYQSRSSTRRGEVNNVRFAHGGDKFLTDEKRMPLEMADVVATSSVSPTRPCYMRRRDPRWPPPVPLPCYCYPTSLMQCSSEQGTPEGADAVNARDVTKERALVITSGDWKT